MSSIKTADNRTIGVQDKTYTVAILRNGKVRRFDVNPVLVSVLGTIVVLFLTSYIAATGYLVFRDELIATTFTHKTRLQHQYEDRIAALRSKIDRMTSSQLIEQQAIAMKVQELMARQDRIGGQAGKMQTLLEQARSSGILENVIPVPSLNPAKPKAAQAIDTITTGSADSAPGDNTTAFAGFEAPVLSSASPALSGKPAFSPIVTRQTFGKLESAIDLIDAGQRQQVEFLRAKASSRTREIAETLNAIGIPADAYAREEAAAETLATGTKAARHSVGGPYLPLGAVDDFDDELNALKDTLERLDKMSATAVAAPLGNPVPGAEISSKFGPRIDPFNGRMAMHGGIDFRAWYGTKVLATGTGVVTKAGRKGGYGKVVEIRHENGLVSRYAHLSKILVKIGQKVRNGETIGKVGSTGRSTGPHLHYEVRVGKKPKNPAKYIRAGQKIGNLL